MLQLVSYITVYEKISYSRVLEASHKLEQNHLKWKFEIGTDTLAVTSVSGFKVRNLLNQLLILKGKNYTDI